MQLLARTQYSTVDKELSNRQKTSGEIKEDVVDSPSHCGLSLVVEVELGNVLDEADNQFQVGEHNEHDEGSQPGEPVHAHTNDADNDKQEHGREDCDGCLAHTLSIAFVDKALRNCHSRDKHSVGGEEKIV